MTFFNVLPIEGTESLAPSPRILSYLARRANAKSPSMALTMVEQPANIQEIPEIFEPPPEVVTTPCDPWPRPYYFHDGLRKVLPYHYTYNTYCKERWRGRELLDIFATEFRDRPKEYYVAIPLHGWTWFALIQYRKMPLNAGKWLSMGKRSHPLSRLSRMET